MFNSSVILLALPSWPRLCANNPSDHRMPSISTNNPPPLSGSVWSTIPTEMQTSLSLAFYGQVGCIQDTKKQRSGLKSKQPDELKRSVLCGILKSDEMLGKHVCGGDPRHYSLYPFSLQPTEPFHLFPGGLPLSSVLPSQFCLYVS